MKIIAKEYSEEEIRQAFPDVDPGFEPFGSRVIVQLRCVKNTTKGGIILPDDAKDTEKWSTQIGKIVRVGPGAFKNRTTGESWFEGAWGGVGDYVRIPKFNQDKWEVEIQEGETNALGHFITKQVLFMLINDVDLLARKIGNPLEVKAYI